MRGLFPQHNLQRVPGTMRDCPVLLVQNSSCRDAGSARVFPEQFTGDRESCRDLEKESNRVSLLSRYSVVGGVYRTMPWTLALLRRSPVLASAGTCLDRRLLIVVTCSRIRSNATFGSNACHASC